MNRLNYLNLIYPTKKLPPLEENIKNNLERKVFNLDSSKKLIGIGNTAKVVSYNVSNHFPKTIVKVKHLGQLPSKPLNTHLQNMLIKHRDLFSISHTNGIHQFQDFQGPDLFSIIESILSPNESNQLRSDPHVYQLFESGQYQNIIFPRLITLCEGINVLHKNEFAYLDIKPENIAKRIIDIDSINPINEKIYRTGTPQYCHPEMSYHSSILKYIQICLHENFPITIKMQNYFSDLFKSNNFDQSFQDQTKKNKNSILEFIATKYNYHTRKYNNERSENLEKHHYKANSYYSFYYKIAHENFNLLTSSEKNIVCNQLIIMNSYSFSPKILCKIIKEVTEISALQPESCQKLKTLLKKLQEYNYFFTQDSFCIPNQNKKSYDIFSLSLTCIAGLLSSLQHTDERLKNITHYTISALMNNDISKEQFFENLKELINKTLISYNNQPAYKIIQFIVNSNFLSNSIQSNYDSAINIANEIRKYYTENVSDSESVDGLTSNESLSTIGDSIIAQGSYKRSQPDTGLEEKENLPNLKLPALEKENGKPQKSVVNITEI